MQPTARLPIFSSQLSKSQAGLAFSPLKNMAGHWKDVSILAVISNFYWGSAVCGEATCIFSTPPLPERKIATSSFLNALKNNGARGQLRKSATSRQPAKAGPMENAPARVLFEVIQGEGGSAEFLSNPEFLFSHRGLCIKCGLTE